VLLFVIWVIICGIAIYFIYKDRGLIYLLVKSWLSNPYYILSLAFCFFFYFLLTFYVSFSFMLLLSYDILKYYIYKYVIKLNVNKFT